MHLILGHVHMRQKWKMFVTHKLTYWTLAERSANFDPGSLSFTSLAVEEREVHPRHFPATARWMKEWKIFHCHWDASSADFSMPSEEPSESNHAFYKFMLRWRAHWSGESMLEMRSRLFMASLFFQRTRRKKVSINGLWTRKQAKCNLVPRASPLKVGGAPHTFEGKDLGTRLSQTIPTSYSVIYGFALASSSLYWAFNNRLKISENRELSTVKIQSWKQLFKLH